MVDLVYTELLPLADGSYHAVERTVAVPEGRVLGETASWYGERYYPLEGVTLPPGAVWHWEPQAAEQAPYLRVLDSKEIRARSRRGALRSTATAESDPVTDISLQDLETATAPIPQVATEEE